MPTHAGVDAVDNDAEDRWIEEIRRRIEQIDRGEIQLISWDQARRRLRERVSR